MKNRNLIYLYVLILLVGIALFSIGMFKYIEDTVSQNPRTSEELVRTINEVIKCL